MRKIIKDCQKEIKQLQYEVEEIALKAADLKRELDNEKVVRKDRESEIKTWQSRYESAMESFQLESTRKRQLEEKLNVYESFSTFANNIAEAWKLSEGRGDLK